jgi:hypothetical protein
MEANVTRCAVGRGHIRRIGKIRLFEEEILENLPTAKESLAKRF